MADSAVLPYYCYARQDRKRQAATFRSQRSFVAEFAGNGGSKPGRRSICMRRRFRAISTCPWIICMRRRCWWITSGTRICRTSRVVSPDAGALSAAPFFCKEVGRAAGHCGQAPRGRGRSEVMHLIGEVRGRTALIVDDIMIRREHW